MAYYTVCPDCGAHLDPCEPCACENTIRVILKRVGQTPEVVELNNTLSALQAAIGGRIETVSFASDAVIICNEEDRLCGLSYNCSLLGIDFYGDIVVCATKGDRFVSLSQAQIDSLCGRLFRARLVKRCSAKPDCRTEHCFPDNQK